MSLLNKIKSTATAITTAAAPSQPDLDALFDGKASARELRALFDGSTAPLVKGTANVASNRFAVVIAPPTVRLGKYGLVPAGELQPLGDGLTVRAVTRAALGEALRFDRAAPLFPSLLSKLNARGPSRTIAVFKHADDVTDGREAIEVHLLLENERGTFDLLDDSPTPEMLAAREADAIEARARATEEQRRRGIARAALDPALLFDVALHLGLIDAEGNRKAVA